MARALEIAADAACLAAFFGLAVVAGALAAGAVLGT